MRLKERLERRRVSQALENAALVISKAGWNQGGYWNRETGAVCILGALNVACRLEPDDTDWDDFRTKLIHEVQFRTRIGGHDGLADWNDAANTTRADVLQALTYTAWDVKNGQGIKSPWNRPPAEKELSQ